MAAITCSRRKSKGKPKKQLTVIKDDGVKHFSQKKLLELWREHYETHLNTSFEHGEIAVHSLNYIQDDFDNNVPEITEEEIKTAISKTKNCKTPGADQITIEIIKAGGEKMIVLLKKIFNKILSTEKTPKDFSKMIVSSVYKKGDKLLRDNYRAIALLSIPGKMFLKILLERMKANVDRKLKESQYGFHAGRGTVDAIFVVRQIIEKAKEKDVPLHFHFIDFKSAFDTIWRAALWKMLLKIGVNPKLVNTINYMYDNTK